MGSLWFYSFLFQYFDMLGSSHYSNSHIKNINIFGKTPALKDLLGRCSSCAFHIHVVKRLHRACLPAGMSLHSSINMCGGERERVGAVPHQFYLVWEPELLLSCCYWEILSCLQSIILRLKCAFVMPDAEHCIQHHVRGRNWRTQLVSRRPRTTRLMASFPCLKPFIPGIKSQHLNRTYTSLSDPCLGV